MSNFRSLTAFAQDATAAVLSPGAVAVDATVGNGHDTLFLARRVAPNGQVAGFDIQHHALQATRTRLEQAGLADLVRLHPCGHQFMLERVPADWAGRVSALMFNLGYLPGSDRQVTTTPGTTLSALDQALTLVRHGGLISLLVYRGHPGAQAEVEAVFAWLNRLGQDYLAESHESPGPVLHLIRRAGA